MYIWGILNYFTRFINVLPPKHNFLAWFAFIYAIINKNDNEVLCD